MLIPIIQIISLASTIISFFFVVKLWQHTRITQISSHKSFFWFFFLISLMTGAFSLPLLLIKNPVIIQIITNLAYLFFAISLSYLFRFTAILTQLEEKVQKIIQRFIVLSGFLIFLWQIFYLRPVELVYPKILGISLIYYSNTAPLFSNFLMGFLGLVVFLWGSFTFLVYVKDAHQSNINRKKALLLCIGFSLASIAIVAYFFLGIPTSNFLYFLIAIIFSLTASPLISRAAFMKSSSR